jgi:aryl-alcohol dehydrogenase-like predicted oxidoreductase
MRYLQLAEKHELPRIVSIQNPYSLLNRSFEVGLSEISHLEGVELLAYSSLAFGTLSGKYLNGARPEGARNTLFSRFTRYSGEQAQLAIAEYVALAKKHGLDPSQMALAFVRQQPFVASTLLGATTLEQLQINIDSYNLTLTEDVLQELEAIHRRYTFPSP